MTVYMVPGVFGVGGQILDSNGKPVSGGLVGTYAAGTTSPVVVFTTATGNVSASNPVVTSADGRLPHELWQTGGQAIKITLTDSLSNTLGGPYDNLTGINDPTALLTTTNTWTASQNFNVINVTTANISTLSVTSITSGTVPLARMRRTEAGVAFSNITVTTGANTITSVNLTSMITGDRVFIDSYFEGTKGATSGRNTLILQASGVSFDFGPGLTQVIQSAQFENGTLVDLTISSLLRVSSSGTLTVIVKATSDGSNTTAGLGNVFTMALIGN